MSHRIYFQFNLCLSRTYIVKLILIEILTFHWRQKYKLYSRRSVFSQLIEIVSGQDLVRAADDDHQYRVICSRCPNIVPTGNTRSWSPADSTSGRGLRQGTKLLDATLLWLYPTAFESTTILSFNRIIVFLIFII